MKQNKDILRFKAYVEQSYKESLANGAQAILNTLPFNTQWEKVYEATVPIVRITQEHSMLQRFAKCLKACVQDKLIMDDCMMLNPNKLHRYATSLYILSTFPYIWDDDTVLHIDRKIDQPNSSKETQLLQGNIYDVL